VRPGWRRPEAGHPCASGRWPHHAATDSKDAPSPRCRPGPPALAGVRESPFLSPVSRVRSMLGGRPPRATPSRGSDSRGGSLLVVLAIDTGWSRGGGAPRARAEAPPPPPPGESAPGMADLPPARCRVDFDGPLLLQRVGAAVSEDGPAGSVTRAPAPPKRPTTPLRPLITSDLTFVRTHDCVHRESGSELLPLRKYTTARRFGID